MVKKFLLLTFLFCTTYTKSFTQNTSENIHSYELKAGDVLEYEVNKYGKNFRLIITLTGKTHLDLKIVNALTFDWETKGDTVMKGSATIPLKERISATEYQWDLSNGSLTLKKKSFLWLSNEVGSTLLQNKSLKIGAGSNSLFKWAGDSEDYDLVFKGKSTRITCLKFKSPDSGQHVIVWQSIQSANPLFVAADMGWTMKLKEIR